jgi:hypothetical protein
MDSSPHFQKASAFAILGLAAAGVVTSRSETPMIRVRRDMLCVTEGTLEELLGQRFAINAPFRDKRTQDACVRE